MIDLDGVYRTCLILERDARRVTLLSGLRYGVVEYKITCTGSNSINYARSDGMSLLIARYLLTRKLHHDKR